MGRQHIHFVEAMPPFKTVISGMRSSCQVAVYVDIKKALKGNSRFVVVVVVIVLPKNKETDYYKIKYT